MSDINVENKPKFNEYAAYEELRMIFVIAIETQNFANLEAYISAWEKKYPLEDFIDTEIVRKIKAILSKDFLSRLIGDYLAAQVLHEQQKQKEAYQKLKDIIDSAKKNKDYSKAEKQISSWKDDLRSQDLSVASFNRYYKAKICTMLLIPSKELTKQAEATHDLKLIVDRVKDMNGENLSQEISQWQNKYTLDDFPTSLQKELNNLTSNLFESILVKTNQENALVELKEFLSTSENITLDSIAKVLEKYDLSTFDDETTKEINLLSQQSIDAFLNNTHSEFLLGAAIAPTYELDAVNTLKKLISNSPHDLDSLVNWIYTNRNINFSSFAKDEIIQLFYSANFKIPHQASYCMPEIRDSLSFKEFREIDSIRKNAIENYLGLLSQGEVVSSTDVQNLSRINSPKIDAEDIPKQYEAIPLQQAQKAIPQTNESFSFVLPAFDNDDHKEDSQNQTNTNPAELVSVEIDKKTEVDIQNIITENDLLQDPLTTYVFNSKSSLESEKETVIEEPSPVEATTTIQDNIHSIVIEDPSITIPVMDNAEPEEELETPSQKILSPKDEENLEKINDNSTYIVVAIPILETVFENKSISKDRKKIEYDTDELLIQKK